MGNKGNKAVFGSGLNRMKEFVEFCMHPSLQDKTIIVAGHSIWFKKFFQVFMPHGCEHVAKHCKVLHRTSLQALPWTGLVCIALGWSALPWTGLVCIALDNWSAPLNSRALHCTPMHCTALVVWGHGMAWHALHCSRGVWQMVNCGVVGFTMSTAPDPN